MLKNYLKVALRGLVKNRMYSWINISGLAVGISVTLLIGLWIQYEFSYDRFLPDHHQVYRLKRHYKTDKVHTSNAIPLPVTSMLREEISGIQYVAEADWGGSAHSLVVGDTKLYLEGTFAGGDFLNIFKFPIRYGDHATALTRPDGIVLTSSTAEALFGEEHPMNRSIRFDNKHELTVTAVVDDLPKNSSIQFKYLIPFSFLEQTETYAKMARTEWETNAFTVYVSLLPEVQPALIGPKIKDLLVANNTKARETEQKLSLQPLTDWHLYGRYEHGKVAGGYIEYLRIFGLIGLLVLLIACINFMNLATARSTTRAKEVGVRKAIGSKRKHLVIQFLSESFCYVIISFILALLMVHLALHPFNSMLDSAIRIPFEDPLFWLIILVYLFITALLAGSRPAFYLSSFQAVRVLKGKVKGTRMAFWSRKALVLLQFSCSIALIAGTFIIYQQLHYVQNRPTGYDQDRLLMSDLSQDMIRNYDALKEELLATGVIENVARSSSSATDITFYSEISDWPGKQAGALPLGVATITISDNYFQTMGMALKNGRDFRSSPSVNAKTVILNEAAVQQMQLTHPIGQSITWLNDQRATVIGVVKDAVMESPFEPAQPTLFSTNGFWTSLLYRIKPGVSTREAIEQLKPVFAKFNPSYPFEYDFVDEVYARKFKLEVTIARLAGLFAGLAVLVSCLGLFGLAAFLAEQRRKEIGIRKVLGATITQIWILLSGEFLLLVLISCLLATPIAIYFLQDWLQQYEYRIAIRPEMFIWAGLLAMAITVLTISFQALRAGMALPAESLRTE